MTRPVMNLSSRPLRRRRGFTLIELLIVVAIMSILAAVAVPNFLDAQIRTKVTRTKADLQALTTALEAYRIDNDAYPIVGNPAKASFLDLYVPYDKRLVPITTPIAYITSIPVDPFFEPNEGASRWGHDPYYAYAPGNLYIGAAAITSGDLYRSMIYSVAGRGPDRKIYPSDYCMAHPKAYESGIAVLNTYDPTNGTLSEGDIIRLGAGILGRKFSPQGAY